VISGIPTPISLITDFTNVGTGIYTSIQVTQLKAMIGTLQSLQVATLGISLVGVGVSVAGFVYMRNRFNALDGRVDQLINIINTGFDNQKKSDMRLHMSRTRSLVQRAQLASTISDSRTEYNEVAAALADQAAYFEGEIVFNIAAKGNMNLELLWQLAQALFLCNSVRIDCRVRTNELRHALVVSEAVASDYQALFNQITPASFDNKVSDGLAAVRVLRDATDAAASKPYLIDYLRTRKISGEEYLQALEQEKESPYLILRSI
jgi:hypothetical protein